MGDRALLGLTWVGRRVGQVAQPVGRPVSQVTLDGVLPVEGEQGQEQW